MHHPSGILGVGRVGFGSWRGRDSFKIRCPSVQLPEIPSGSRSPWKIFRIFLHRKPNKSNNQEKNYCLVLMVALHTRIKFLVIFYIVLGGSIDRSNGDTPADTDQDIEDNLLWIGSSSSACETPSVQDVPIAGYLPDYRFFGDLNLTTTMPLLDDLIVFSIEVSADGSTGGCCLGNDHYKAISEAKFHQQNPSRTWIAIGGAGRNQQWPMMASNEKSRKRFLESVEQLCKKEGFQGIDLDLYSSVRTKSQHTLFLDFLQEASTYWHQRGLLLSLPLHVSQVLPRSTYDYADQVHLMSYDSPANLPPTSNARHIARSRMQHAAEGIKALIQSGCHPSKIWVGVPFYGSSIQRPGEVQSFSEALPQPPTAKQTKAIDEALRQNFLGYQWDSPAVIRTKMQLVKKQGLGGIFVWELGQDRQIQSSNSSTSAAVLSAIAQASKTARRCEEREKDTIAAIGSKSSEL